MTYRFILVFLCICVVAVLFQLTTLWKQTEGSKCDVIDHRSKTIYIVFWIIQAIKTLFWTNYNLGDMYWSFNARFIIETIATCLLSALLIGGIVQSPLQNVDEELADYCWENSLKFKNEWIFITAQFGLGVATLVFLLLSHTLWVIFTQRAINAFFKANTIV